ncbi:MAG: hypothetical protein LYZ66_02015 [Nitrososphaerales archaeon]|nr:hypothetical protein [Nitrososphaerales archaeon]
MRRELIAFLSLLLMVVASSPVQPSFAAQGAPSSLSLVVVPPTLPADGGEYRAVYVSLLDNSKSPTAALTNTTVFLTVSNATISLLVNASVAIPAGQNFVVAQFRTTSTPGMTLVTASATGYESASASVTTAIPTGNPTSISAYVAPPSFVPTRPQTKANLIVQLQDAKGNPARARANTIVTITSSNVKVQNATLLATIGQGADYVVVPMVPVGPGSTTFTVLSSGLAPGTARLQAFGSTFEAQLNASPLTILTNETTSVTLTITLDGQGLSGASVQWTGRNGNVLPGSSTTNSGGQATAVFTPSSSGVGEVYAVFTSPAVGVNNLTTTIVVSQAEHTGNPGLLKLLTSFPYVLVIPVAVVGGLAGVVVLRRRRRKVQEITDEGYESSSG